MKAKVQYRSTQSVFSCHHRRGMVCLISFSICLPSSDGDSCEYLYYLPPSVSVEVSLLSPLWCQFEQHGCNLKYVIKSSSSDPTDHTNDLVILVVENALFCQLLSSHLTECGFPWFTFFNIFVFTLGTPTLTDSSINLLFGSSYLLLHILYFSALVRLFFFLFESRAHALVWSNFHPKATQKTSLHVFPCIRIGNILLVLLSFLSVII